MTLPNSGLRHEHQQEYGLYAVSARLFAAKTPTVSAAAVHACSKLGRLVIRVFVGS